MSTDPTRTPPPPLTQGQRDALVRLLDDDDESIAGIARQRLVDEGQSVVHWLRPYTLSNNAILRRRTRDILLHFEALDADQIMRSFCRRAGEDLDLEEGALRLAQTRYPELNHDAYRAQLDEWALLVSDSLPEDRQNVDDVLAALHSVLFEKLGFRGNESDYYQPENSYINRVLDRRTGNPISLCTVVLFIARRLSLPITGIGLPAHFLCRYQSATRQVYLDAFNGGRVLSRADCIAFVNQLGRPFDESFLQPFSSRRMLQRMCVNLEHAYENLELRSDLVRIRTYHALLSGG